MVVIIVMVVVVAVSLAIVGTRFPRENGACSLNANTKRKKREGKGRVFGFCRNKNDIWVHHKRCFR